MGCALLLSAQNYHYRVRDDFTCINHIIFWRFKERIVICIVMVYPVKCINNTITIVIISVKLLQWFPRQLEY